MADDVLRCSELQHLRRKVSPRAITHPSLLTSFFPAADMLPRGIYR